MEGPRKRDIFLFFGALAVLGVGVVFSFRYIQASSGFQLVNHFTPATSTPDLDQNEGPGQASTSFSLSSAIQHLVDTFTGQGSATNQSSSAPVDNEPSSSVPDAPAPTANVTAPASSSQPIATKALPYSVGVFNSGFVAGDGWQNWWGDSTEANNILTIQANASSTGGGVLLQGSGAWTNLTFTATVNWMQGETFGIIAHYIDDNDYLVCQYDEKYTGDVHLRLDEHLDGNVIHLADGDLVNYEEQGGANIPVGIQIQGDNGTCAFDGAIISSVISSDRIDPSLSHGEIGFTTWDPNLDNSKITVTKVGVTETIYSLGTYVEQQPE